MERRKFLVSSLAASALAVTTPGSYAAAAQGAMQGKGREFYQLRRYHLNSGPQRKLCDDFFRDALLPALGRLSISPVGVFDVSIGPETPSIYVLMPSLSAEALATVPAATATHGPRVFELRIYEGATDQDHRRKVEMMQSGESEIFTKAGVEQVFYSETLIGSRLPNLTYMLAFDSLADRDKKWAAFRASDEWKSYSTQPKYAFEAIVSTINNFILTPIAYSQI